MQVAIGWEQLEDRLVGGRDVTRVAGQRRPAERSLPLAEEGSDVRRYEARVVERPAETAELCLGAKELP